MRLAKEHFGAQGWKVHDVSRRESYDLRCTRGGDELRVEVKGTTSDGSSVLLTAHEVQHARERHPAIALFVVSEIKVQGTEATGGEVRLIEPWRVDDGELKPIAFNYLVP